MAEPGDVVTVDFPGATGLKRRPAIIVSTRLYHAHRPDVIIAVLTSNVAAANTVSRDAVRGSREARGGQ